MKAGTRLGPYEIVAAVGAGGMGEVYRARDTRLDREVAIKVLSSQVLADPAFHERFDREARAISQLNHPHICVLHDVGTENGVPYLVLEYLEGETLAARLARGVLPLDQALTIGTQICDALERAHRHGIVHRDLKPANVMLTRSGAKLLDFGLAKPAAPALRFNTGAVTVSAPLTADGIIVGTLPYMSPEQVEGRDADVRSDIFAFGALLYEMVAGRRAFEGKTPASVIAAILERQPPALSTVAPVAPPALDHVIARCLAKDPDERWQNAGDVMRELRWIAATPIPSSAASKPTARRWVRTLQVAGLVAAAAAGALLMRTWQPPRGGAGAPRHLAVVVPEGHFIPPALARQIAISRDGSMLVFSALKLPAGGSRYAYQDDQRPQGTLFVKRIGDPEAVPLAGTEGGRSPFLSPDGTWVGFFRRGSMYKAPLNGGATVQLADRAGGANGASWSDSGFIVYTPVHGGGIWRVNENGGIPEQLTHPDPSKGERGHHHPAMLPGSNAFLFTIERLGRNHDDAAIAVHRLDTKEQRVVLEGGMSAEYDTRHIVYGRQGQLLAARFDLTTLAVIGPPIPVLSGVRTAPGSGAADFAIAGDGSLAYVPGASIQPRHTLEWIDRAGKAAPLAATPDDYLNPRISPDGSRAAVEVGGADDDLWIIDLARGARQRLTTESENRGSVWYPNGDRLIISSERLELPGLYSLGVTINAPAERLMPSAFPVPSSLAPDGSVLAFSESGETTGVDVWTLRLSDQTRTPLLNSRFDEDALAFSPDGHWIAYVSDETGQPEVFVARYPDLSGKRPISVNGGSEPVWSRHGRELFYRQDDGLMAVAITTTPALSVGTPRLLFRGMYRPGVFGLPGYDVSPDGQHFLMVALDQNFPLSSRVNYVIGWSPTLLSARPPTAP